MPVSPAYRPEPRFFDLGADYGDAVKAAEFPQTILRLRNDRAAAEVGLETLSDAEWLAHFGRFEPLPGQPGPTAMRYHGHQFRVYNPDIGDGRGFLAAQMRETPQAALLREQGDRDTQPPRLLDLGTKGSGQTPWSRHADGRLTLKGGMREALAAAMLDSLGVPTCRILSLIETGENLERHDEPSPTRAAVMVRLSHSHIRFGTFQRAAYYGRKDQIETLMEHARSLYHPAVAPGDAAGFLAAVVEASAALTAKWIAAGFVHGVLNTDNLNVTGESFDYGPWRFLPHYEPGFTAAYFDQNGLYAFARQPEAVFWNLTQLAGCLKLIADAEPQVAILTEALNGFGPAYIRHLRAAFLNRLGVQSLGEAADQRLLDATLALAREKKEALRWEPIFFDWFGGFSSAARALGGVRGKTYQGKAFDAFRFALMEHEPDRPERLEHPMFAAPEPEEMLIDEVEALWSAIDTADDWAPLQAKLARLEAAKAAWSL
ncbi:Selenoprotein O and cysteine-containing homologs [Brevundimonas diminuta 3F5N]|uniref:Selenoprotein O and cysteine-containing homologs n=1 Tax=Brevundimonas diminuta 3F5N TaxID=1255603 RepID=A0A1R4FWA1_BREDI|nr:YdiU family protein [Brevundimonas diminuta]SJM60107.1 Selenoprotein O and cysteine-containing homologs [Brevundimonas diminuta 3F5N]